VATLAETIWVHNQAELESTVARLVGQGGVVQDQTGDEVHLFLKKKMNVVVLVVGLILCLVPGLAYLIWYSTADQSQAITVKIGDAPNIGGYHPDESTEDAATPTGPAATASLPEPSGVPAEPVPPSPAADPVPPIAEASPMPPAPGDTPPPAPPPPTS
jgi:hypothetical protein